MADMDRVHSALIDALVEGAADTVDLPHVVVTEADGDLQVCGPFATVVDAMVAAERLHFEDPDVTVTVVALRAPALNDARAD